MEERIASILDEARAAFFARSPHRRADEIAACEAQLAVKESLRKQLAENTGPRCRPSGWHLRLCHHPARKIIISLIIRRRRRRIARRQQPQPPRAASAVGVVLLHPAWRNSSSSSSRRIERQQQQPQQPPRGFFLFLLHLHHPTARWWWNNNSSSLQPQRAAKSAAARTKSARRRSRRTTAANANAKAKMMMRMRRTKSRHCRTTTNATKKICIFSAARSETGGWRQLRSEEEALEDRIVDLEFEVELFERGGLLDQLQSKGSGNLGPPHRAGTEPLEKRSPVGCLRERARPRRAVPRAHLEIVCAQRNSRRPGRSARAIVQPAAVQ